MQSFQDLNNEITKAQEALETSILATKEAEERKALAEIALIRATADKTKARLGQKLYDDRVNSLREMSYNLRAESRVR